MPWMRQIDQFRKDISKTVYFLKYIICLLVEGGTNLSQYILNGPMSLLGIYINWLCHTNLN